jgi:hypothetical protein
MIRKNLGQRYKEYKGYQPKIFSQYLSTRLDMKANQLGIGGADNYTIFDNIIDYLQLHYLGDRSDTKFWQDKPFKLTEFNNENLPLFKRGIFLNTKNKNNYMFRVPNFYQVAAGLNLIDRNLLTESINLNRATYNNVNRERAIEVLNSIKNITVISHRDYLNLASYNYLHKRDLNEN